MIAIPPRKTAVVRISLFLGLMAVSATGLWAQDNQNAASMIPTKPRPHFTFRGSDFGVVAGPSMDDEVRSPPQEANVDSFWMRIGRYVQDANMQKALARHGYSLAFPVPRENLSVN